MTNTQTTPNEAKAIDQAMIEQEIGKISAFIEMARKHLAEDKLVDVVALEGKVKSLCDKLNIAGDNAAETARPAITKIRENLDALDKELSTQFERLTTSMAGSARNHATAAYAKSSDDA
jgi:hypothetical protein